MRKMAVFENFPNWNEPRKLDKNFLGSLQVESIID